MTARFLVTNKLLGILFHYINASRVENVKCTVVRLNAAAGCRMLLFVPSLHPV